MNRKFLKPASLLVLTLVLAPMISSIILRPSVAKGFPSKGDLDAYQPDWKSAKLDHK